MASMCKCIQAWNVNTPSEGTSLILGGCRWQGVEKVDRGVAEVRGGT
jgi:hypothetical protein